MNLLHFPEGMQIAVVHLLFLPPEKISLPKPAPSLENDASNLVQQILCCSEYILQRYCSEQNKVLVI